MSDDIANLGFAVDTKGLVKGERALKRYAKAGDNAEQGTSRNAKSISASFGMITAAIGATASAMLSLNKVIDVQREFDVLNAQLITATGSAKNAADAMSAITQFAARTPFDLAQATAGFTQLVNLGLTPSEAALTSYGNTASAMGKDLSQMIEAVADATTGEFERLKEFGIKASSEGENVSLTFQGVTTTIGKNAAEIEKFLTDLGDVNFDGAMALRMDTLDGRISNFEDSWDTLFLTVSQSGLGEAMEDSVDTAIMAVNELTNMIASGQVQGLMDVVSNSWSRSFGDIATNMSSLGNSLLKDLNAIGINGSSIGELISDSFFNFPANIRAAIDIAIAELNAFVGKAGVIAVAVGQSLNPFDDMTEDQISDSIQEQFEQIDATVSKTYAEVKARRDESIKSITEELQSVEKLRSAYDATAKAATEAAKGVDNLAKFKVKPALNGINQIEDKVKSLKKTVDKTDVFGGITGSIGDSLDALKGFTNEGSKEYAKLSVAADAFNAVQAISAVINQAASGDPFSAFPRMAAMIGAMASLGQSIGSLGGDLADTSAANQASQGNNVWGDKAASISDSIDMTANATDKLVGINTDMLNALRGLQQGIFAASGISARASEGVTFDISASRVNENPLENLVPAAALNTFDVASLGLFSKIFNGIGKVLGGSRKVTDQGIQIVGGSIDDLINSVSVNAFQEVKSKKYAWSSTKIRTYLTPISEASQQFSLVFGSLADSVFAGATSLGFASDEVEQAINEFNVATTRISLKGLSIEDQTEQIEAVFSKIFNDLSVAVIPFLSDFQKTGEELGETLARLSTQVAVAEFAVDALGIELGDKLADPEMFAKITDNLSMLAGGVEEFADKTASFTETFAPESVKLELHTNALTKSLEEVGLALPATADGFFMLMQGLNGTTEEGQKQIATLLNVQETASDYYDLVEDYTDRLSGLSSSLEGAISGIFGVSRATTNLSIDSALAAARLGDFSRALGLDLSRVSANQSEFSTLADFNIQQAETANKLSELNALTMGSVSVSDMTLTANQEQVSLLTSIDNNIASAYVPQQTQIQNNDNVVVELKALRADVETIKDASESIARSSASSEDDLDAIRRNGLDVRLEA